MSLRLLQLVQVVGLALLLAAMWGGRRLAPRRRRAAGDDAPVVVVEDTSAFTDGPGAVGAALAGEEGR